MATRKQQGKNKKEVSNNTDTKGGSVATKKDKKTYPVIVSGTKNKVGSVQDVKTVDGVTVASWNVSAINQNPFEYWMDYDDEYNDFMEAVNNLCVNQEIVENGSAITVKDVFTPTMYKELVKRMDTLILDEHENLGTAASKGGWASCHEENWKAGLEQFWSKGWVQMTMKKNKKDGKVVSKETKEASLKSRNIISEFINDVSIGDKRLASGPDRMVNTISQCKEKAPDVYRPTVINNYKGELSVTEKWWEDWLAFMFHEQVEVKGKTTTPVCMLTTLKYKPLGLAKPKQDGVISLPLQTLCLAIFDAILIKMVAVAEKEASKKKASKKTATSGKKKVPAGTLKQRLIKAFVDGKDERCIKLLEKACYKDVDIFCLQEVSAGFIQKLDKTQTKTKGTAGDAKSITARFHVVQSQGFVQDSGQNSIILLNKKHFAAPKKADEMNIKAISKKDLVAIKTVYHKKLKAKDGGSGIPMVVASYHGDSSGKDTIAACTQLKAQMPTKHKLIFGLDANTYAVQDAKKKNLTTLSFAKYYKGAKMHSAWDASIPDAKAAAKYINDNCRTTFSARTMLQTQTQKAVDKASMDNFKAKKTGGNKINKNINNNPKDYILFGDGDFPGVGEVWNDNTGARKEDDTKVFPNQNFPSDHALIGAFLHFKSKTLAVPKTPGSIAESMPPKSTKKIKNSKK